MTLDQPVLELVRDHTAPVAITCDSKTCENWLVRRWTNHSWVVEGKATVSGETLLTATGGDYIALITNRRIVVFKKGIIKAIPYQPSRQESNARITSTLATPSHIWIGRNAGEWGGSLERIDLATGKSRNIEKPIDRRPPGTMKVAGDAAYRLITNVNGLLAAPWNPDCILVAQGLVHFDASGEIMQVCGSEEPKLFYHATLSGHQEVPFYGLAKSRDGGVWAAGINGLYEITANGRARRTPMPRFVPTGGAAISFMTPDLALVLTDIQRQTSMSGRDPMLVPLDASK